MKVNMPPERINPMSEHDQLEADLRLNESRYAAAKQLRDHESARQAAEEITRLNGLLVLMERQRKEEAK
jgi:hypothetical protein